MKTKGVIFDKDGTLLKFSPFWVRIAQKAVKIILERINADLSLENEMLSSIGVKDEDAVITGSLCRGTYNDIADDFFTVLKKAGEKVSVQTVCDETVKAFHECLCLGEVEPISDKLPNVLQELKSRGIKIAVLTSDDEKGTAHCLEKLKITKYFDAVYACDGITPPKPDTAYLKTFLEEMRLSRDEVVMIGDTLTDMDFAKNGGIYSIGIAENKENRMILEGVADSVTNDFAQIPDLLP